MEPEYFARCHVRFHMRLLAKDAMSMADRDRRDKERGRLRRRRSKERMREQRASEMGGEGWLDPYLTFILISLQPRIGEGCNFIFSKYKPLIRAVQRICTAPRSIPVEQEQDSVLRKGEMSIQKNI